MPSQPMGQLAGASAEPLKSAVKIDPVQAQPKSAACKGACAATPAKIFIIHTNNFEIAPATPNKPVELEAIIKSLKSQGMTLIIAKGKIYLVGPKSKEANPCTIVPTQCVPETLHQSPDGTKLYFTGFLEESSPCSFTLQGLRTARASAAKDLTRAELVLLGSNSSETPAAPSAQEFHAAP